MSKQIDQWDIVEKFSKLILGFVDKPRLYPYSELPYQKESVEKVLKAILKSEEYQQEKEVLKTGLIFLESFCFPDNEIPKDSEEYKDLLFRRMAHYTIQLRKIKEGYRA